MVTVNLYYVGSKSLSHFIKDNHELFFAKNNQSILVQIFTGNYNRDFLKLLIIPLRKLLPQAQIVGTTSSGEIMNGGMARGIL